MVSYMTAISYIFQHMAEAEGPSTHRGIQAHERYTRSTIGNAFPPNHALNLWHFRHEMKNKTASCSSVAIRGRAPRAFVVAGSLTATCRAAIIGDHDTRLHSVAVRYARRRLRASAAAGCTVCSKSSGAGSCRMAEEPRTAILQEPRSGHSVFSWLGSFNQLGMFAY